MDGVRNMGGFSLVGVQCALKSVNGKSSLVLIYLNKNKRS